MKGEKFVKAMIAVAAIETAFLLYTGAKKYVKAKDTREELNGGITMLYGVGVGVMALLLDTRLTMVKNQQIIVNNQALIAGFIKEAMKP